MNPLHFIKMAIKRAVWFMRDVRSHYFFTSSRAFGCNRGVFQSFAQAAKSAPKYAKTDYTEQTEEKSFHNFLSGFSTKIADYEDPVISHFKASTLSFTQNPSEHYDVFFSSGAIQYVEQYRSLLHTLLHKNTGGGG